jgi:integrase
MRRNGSTFIQFRKRIPKDVLSKVGGVTLAIPIGDEVAHVVVSANAAEITCSLRTRDPREAKERHTCAATYLDSVWQSLREGPKRLTQKQIAALAGEAYRSPVALFEDDPGNPFIWKQIDRLHAEAMEGGEATREQWFGETVDQILARHHLVVDTDSRLALIEAASKAIVEASARLGRNAEGDYSPDTVERRFPPLDLTKGAKAASPLPQGSQTITGLAEGWWREAEAAGRAVSTHEAYQRVAQQLSEFLGHDDARAVTKDDVIAFKDYRLSQGVSLKTIGGGDISAIRQLFAWGIANRRVSHNPAVGVKVAKVKKKRTRDPGFSDGEAIAILSEAFHHKKTGKAAGHLSNARRWVPWLCAYSGARVGEMAQLRKQDLRQDNGLWIIRITPEAGTVKDGDYRDVPLHPHLIDQGFPEFVSKAADGFLFMKVFGNTPDARRAAWRTTKNRVTEFVRETVTDPEVQPNHAWRHRFMTLGRNLGISRDVRFSITGHEPGAEGDDYGIASNEAKAVALAKYPRYEVKPSA